MECQSEPLGAASPAPPQCAGGSSFTAVCRRPPPSLPCFEQGLKLGAQVNVAGFADAEEQEAVQDALDGLVEPRSFEQIGAVVVADQVGGQGSPLAVQEVEEIGVEMPRRGRA